MSYRNSGRKAKPLLKIVFKCNIVNMLYKLGCVVSDTDLGRLTINFR